MILHLVEEGISRISMWMQKSAPAILYGFDFISWKCDRHQTIHSEITKFFVATRVGFAFGFQIFFSTEMVFS